MGFAFDTVTSHLTELCLGGTNFFFNLSTMFYMVIVKRFAFETVTLII